MVVGCLMSAAPIIIRCAKMYVCLMFKFKPIKMGSDSLAFRLQIPALYSRNDSCLQDPEEQGCESHALGRDMLVLS